MELQNKLRVIISPKWRPSNKFSSRGKLFCMMVPYIDARDVMNRLDTVLGFDKWKDRYYTENGILFCELSLLINGTWISKSGAGAKTKIESEKGAASDALKRAAVKFGINRDAYQYNNVMLPAKEYGKSFAPIDEKTERFLKGEELYKVCNEKAVITQEIEMASALDLSHDSVIGDIIREANEA